MYTGTGWTLDSSYNDILTTYTVNVLCPWYEWYKVIL